MTRVGILRSLAFAAMALGLLGCGQGGRVLRDDERIRYVAHGEATADEADIELVLEQLEEMAALFGVPVPRVEYNLYPSSAEIIEFTDVCAPGREAPVAIDCFDAGRIYAGTPVQSHELVHAVVAALGGGPRILNEGLATLFGGDRDNRTDLFSVGSLRADVNLALLLSQTWTQQVDEVGSLDAYLRAADITRFLIEELGWAEFLMLLRRTQDAVTREEMAAALEASFELDEAQLEERLRAFALVPSQIPWRVLKSTSLELEEGKPGERGQHLATTFVHEAGQRTRLDVLEGSIDLIHETEGKVHVAYLATSEANATVLLDGAPGRYFVSGLARVVLSRVALTEPVEFDGGFSLGPAQLCVGIGSFRVLGAFEGEGDQFITDYPESFDVCVGDACESVATWVAGKRRSFERMGPFCVTPGATFPVHALSTDGQATELTATANSGRFIRYQVTRVE